MKTSEADMATMEKKGFATGLYAIHPITGEAVPIWVANFVLMSYGSGAVMSVPAHDVRDWEFAKKYHLPIVQVITSANEAVASNINIEEGAYTEKGVLLNSYDYSGLTSAQAVDSIASFLEKKKKGRKTINYRLRDWGVSRQRYWGCPIPIIYCDDCGAVAVPDEDLPVELPTDIVFDESGASPIKNMPEFYETSCPKCGKSASRETDTFDTFFESSWYYARYTGPDNDKSMLDERADYWLPVDQYVGGIEHAVLHLLYARFFNKLMRDEGLVECDEPFTNLLTQGMVLADTYYVEGDGGGQEWIAPKDIEIEYDKKGKSINIKDNLGRDVHASGMSKMSKSKNNGVDPQQLIEKYGADTLRVFSMFAAPPDQSMEWSDTGVEGANRFIKRLWRQVFIHLESRPLAGIDTDNLTDEQSEMRRKIFTTLQKVTDDMARRFTFNTAIAANMELLNELFKFHEDSDQGRAIRQETLEHIILMLSPIMPHVCQELWVLLGKKGAVMDEPWPETDESALVQSKIQMMIQINGKLRGKVDVAVDTDDDDVKALALKNENVQTFLKGVTVRKVIVVKGRLINIVAN
jgi:leucyl-tRNA synthetase